MKTSSLCCLSYIISRLIDQPTRYRLNQEPSLLDLILVNDRNCKRNLEFKDPLEHSDHCVLTFEFLCHDVFQSIDGKLKYSVRSIYENEFSMLLKLHNKSFNNTQFVSDDDELL
jgi:hypothetical protein